MTADPLSGEPDAIRGLARRLDRQADQVHDGAARLRDAVHTAGSDWGGSVQRQFLRSAGEVEPAAVRVIGRLEAGAGVLREYAAEVERIQDEASALQAARGAAAHDASTTTAAVRRQRGIVDRVDAVEADTVRLDRLEADLGSIAALRSRLDAQWAELVDRRARADHRAAAGLESQDVLGRLVSFASDAPTMSDTAFLAALAALPPEQIAALRRNSDIADRLAGMSAGEVARWWDSMGGRGSRGLHSAAQAELIAAFPAVIGNLNGVAYWARDLANRTSLRMEQRSVRTQLGITRERAARSESRSDGLEIDVLEARLRQLRNFRDAERSTMNVPDGTVRQMISFTPGSPPLGAFSLGDVDDAAGVSFVVPGMGTTLANTTELMRGGSNILQRQTTRHPNVSTAIITWIGYETPLRPPLSFDVLGSALASAGAERLHPDLEAFRLRRPDAQLNVIAHSYGSTTAALALANATDLDVHAFIALGSAGMPTSVADASRLQVDHMFAAQADERGSIAWWGRFGSLTHHQDPTGGFGASVIDTSGGGGWNEVNDHGLLVNGADHPDDFGYLDAGTKTVAALANVTLP